MSECELSAIYQQASPGTIPIGHTPGWVIYRPGSLATKPAALALKATVWQGKYWPDPGTMVNRSFGLPSVKTFVYEGESFHDGKPSICMDYANTLLFKACRDEMREVSPGVYLGILYRRGARGPELRNWFVVEAKAK